MYFLAIILASGYLHPKHCIFSGYSLINTKNMQLILPEPFFFRSDGIYPLLDTPETKKSAFLLQHL